MSLQLSERQEQVEDLWLSMLQKLEEEVIWQHTLTLPPLYYDRK
jgi:hypothetical protein